ncbi:FAD-binding and (Fe-S)-binding domain-containing protein [Streptomyces europaeiscabiei]|uniref:FAD-binding and (Fe-S)-binding domain-containing protein n=1 Tax=Streptomyces europaeiscabiei TaxID=146819 RepID=UPI0029A53C01|nr:FAD-binding and (Fe-S)-binding domain-containing protein [Streptomyces europaeiscabiei]MDX3710493.1 FAD-binding and (Fe-S)-binding domain-containing protein [Streptomyces europaeiscabiei]
MPTQAQSGTGEPTKDSSTASREDLAAALRAVGVEFDDSPLTRALYSSDASLYRVVPSTVVRARNAEDVIATHQVASELRVPVTMRGAGTSIAGNAVGSGIVVDTRRFDRVLDIDPVARTARVEPGVVHADLQRAAAPHGLRFGPDPSSHSRCTIGGMIGNNACGSRALGYGRTVDNVESLRVLYGNGELAVEQGGRPGGTTARRLAAVGDANLLHLRTEFGRFGRQVSGYGLEHLLPERRRIERFLVGSEGSLATVLEATVRLVDDRVERRMLVLGYPTMADAADAVPALLAAVPGRLIACEGMDARIVDLVREKGSPVPDLPRGSGWLFAEVAGEDAPDSVRRLVAAGAALDSRLIDDPREAAALWRIREDGAGLAGRSLSTPAYGGWEDAAVPPEHLGAWLRDFEALLRAHGLQGIPYGHFGDGCIHCRIDFPFQPGDPASAGVFREFMTACATRLRDYRGTLSGEHGDGRVRGELLPLMYDEASLTLFQQVKAVCDPDGILNPGIIADPVPITDDLRPVRPQAPVRSGLRLVHDAGDLGAAVHRCTGVGTCVAPRTAGVMCPSYLATRNERDSTRGRARVLQEALDGGLLLGGLRDPAVTEALDLCLACKGCASDCPSGVDMATYKSEVLHQRHDVAGVRRPRSHLFLGQLPKWARLTAPLASVANLLLRVKPFAGLAKWAAGIDHRRSVPKFASPTLRKATHASRTADASADVWIWADSFTDHFFPESGLAAIRFLESHGLAVRVIPEDACCGLTWITTGRLDHARSIVSRTVRTLAPYIRGGIPVMALEPSCLASLRSDARELCDAQEVDVVAAGVLSFAELVERLDLPLPDLTGVEVVAQPHCHQSAVIGWDTDRRLLERAGATVTKVQGCCGLAGNFGVEKGHYEVSVAVAETHLLPAVRAHSDAVFLADGMSCRVQLDDLADVSAQHLAELFASRV